MNIKRQLVFVVEDNKAYRLLISRVVESKGYVVMGFEDGEKAFEMLEFCKPNLILSEIEMPLMDGFKLSKSIKKNFPEFKIPFIFISSTSSAAVIKKAEKLSSNKMLEKPVTPDALFSSISSALEISAA